MIQTPISKVGESDNPRSLRGFRKIAERTTRKGKPTAARFGVKVADIGLVSGQLSSAGKKMRDSDGSATGLLANARAAVVGAFFSSFWDKSFIFAADHSDHSMG